MNLRSIRNQHLLLAAAFLLALAVRMLHINRTPLSNDEASLALQALTLARSAGAAIAPHPAYLALTSAWMFLFGASNFTARFWPALAGSLLVFAPLLFQFRIGRVPAVILSILIALDPALVAVSTRVGSLSLAILFLSLAFGFWYRGRAIPAGIFAGATLLAGPLAWAGIISLAAAALVTRRVWRKPAPEAARAGDGTPILVRRGTADARLALFAALLTLFFAGTLFFTMAQGLGGAAGSLPAYLSTWFQPAGTPAWLVLLALVVYGFFPLVFGLWGAVTGLLRRDPADQFLLAWLTAALLLALLPAGRQATSAAWPVLPLLALASRQLARFTRIHPVDRLPVIGQALLTALILGFISMTLASVVNNPQLAANQENWIRLAGAVVMLGASTALIAWGWTRFVALRGFAWGLAAVLFLYVISSAWRVSGIMGEPPRELWDGSPRMVGADLLRETVRQLNQIAPYTAGQPDLVVAGQPEPALRWALRDAPSAREVNFLPTDASPALVVTPLQDELALASPYRGQGLPAFETVDWATFRATDWFRWLIFRTVPELALHEEQLIVWARTDLFPSGEEPSSPAPQ